MNITNPPNVNFSQIVIDSGLDLSGGDFDIALKAGRTVDGKDVSDAMLASVYDAAGKGIDVYAYRLKVVDGQGIVVTGTATDPININDDNTATVTFFDALTEYVEFDFGKDYVLSQFRMYHNSASHDGTGRYKIQYWNGSTWVDWKTAIPTSGVIAWTSWEIVSIILTQKIRLIATTLDPRGGDTDGNVCGEFEIKF